jgi:hypothetical protein
MRKQHGPNDSLIFISLALIWLMLAAIVYEIGHRGVVPWFLVFMAIASTIEAIKIWYQSGRIEKQN